MKIFIFLWISLLSVALSVYPVDHTYKNRSKNSEMQVNNLSDLMAFVRVPQHTKIVCGKGPVATVYIAESDVTSHLDRRITLSREQSKFFGKITQNMRVTLMKPLDNSANCGQVHITRDVQTTGCGRAITIAAYTTGILVYTSAAALLAMAYKI
jgi:hypothetical protein